MALTDRCAPLVITGKQAQLLHAQADGGARRELPRAEREAHERLGNTAMRNEQSDRAMEGQRAATAARDAGALPPDDRRLADIFGRLACLRLADAPAARQHYTHAIATLRLRRAHIL